MFKFIFDYMLLVFQFLAQFYHNFFIFLEQNIQCVKSERRTGQGLSTQADPFKAKQVFKNSGRRKCTTICKRLCNVLQIFFQRRAIKLTMMLCIIHPINIQTLEPLLDIGKQARLRSTNKLRRNMLYF